MKRERQHIEPAFCAAATASIVQFLTGLNEAPDLERVPERYRDLARRDHERLVNQVRTDPHMERRLAQCKCLRCQYRGVVAGAALTSRPCGLCLEDQVYGSTNTGVLCVPCAKEHHLCAHCGGDINGDTNRTNYPTSTVEVAASEQDAS